MAEAVSVKTGNRSGRRRPSILPRIALTPPRVRRRIDAVAVGPPGRCRFGICFPPLHHGSGGFQRIVTVRAPHFLAASTSEPM
jgi:hypothetical protein